MVYCSSSILLGDEMSSWFRVINSRARHCRRKLEVHVVVKVDRPSETLLISFTKAKDVVRGTGKALKKVRYVLSLSTRLIGQELST